MNPDDDMLLKTCKIAFPRKPFKIIQLNKKTQPRCLPSAQRNGIKTGHLHLSSIRFGLTQIDKPRITW